MRQRSDQAKRSNVMVFRTFCWQKKSESSSILYGTGLSRVSIADREKQYRTLRAICNIREEMGGVDKFHATREESLHCRKSDCRGHDSIAPDSYRTLGSKTQCHCPRYRKSHMVVHPDMHTEPIQKSMTSPVAQ